MPEHFDMKLKHFLEAYLSSLHILVVDEVHKVFDHKKKKKRKIFKKFSQCYVMALTATLNDSQIKLLCEDYLKFSVLIR